MSDLGPGFHDTGSDDGLGCVSVLLGIICLIVAIASLRCP